MDEQNRKEIEFIRHELNPKISSSEPPTTSPYIEARRIVWSPEGGNVILVVPMGQEAIRVQAESPTHDVTNLIANSRTVAISSPSASIVVTAPNGAAIGTLTISGMKSKITLLKNMTARASLGVVTLNMNAKNLIFGEKFRRPRILCSAVPTFDGASPRNWEYSVYFSFDGVALKAEIRQLSCSIRSANVSVPTPNISASEEVLITAPANNLVIVATAESPQSTASLESTFLLRDI